MLVRATGEIRRSVGRLLQVAGQLAGSTSNIPQLEATAPVLGKIVDEAVVHPRQPPKPLADELRAIPPASASARA